jgi:hypothetical protein
LGELGSSLYFKAGLILCRRDYLRWGEEGGGEGKGLWSHAERERKSLESGAEEGFKFLGSITAEK